MAHTYRTQVSVGVEESVGGQTAGVRTSRTQPRTPHEEAILAIWRDVLGRSDIDVSDDFFVVGDHSLVPAVVARIRQSLDVDLRVTDFFESRTVSELASAVAARSSAKPRAVNPRPPDAEPVLSFDQQRIWMESQLLPDAVYNNHARRRLVGRLDVDTMERSIRAIIRRHEALRTRFPTVAGRPVQVVDEFDDNWRLRVEDVTGTGNDPTGATFRLLDEDATTQFDLAGGPLFRCLLIRLSDTEHILGLTLHQIISDSRSIYTFERELAALYQASGDVERADLPALSVQYRDYAVWQRERLVGETLERQVSYWREHLRDAPPVLALPTVQRRTTSQGADSERVGYALSADETAALRELCRAHDVTPFMVLLAGLATVFGRWSGQSDIVIGVAYEGRADGEVDKLMGIFFNVLPMRTDLSGNPSFGELLGRVRRVALDGYAHAEAPIDVVMADLQVTRDPRRTPVFEVVLNVTAPPDIERVPGLTVESMGTSTPRTRFDLFINAQESGGRVWFTFDFGADRFDAATMSLLADHLGRLLRAAIADPTKGILDYSLRADEDTGDRTAVVDPQGGWSYGWLRQAADRVAHVLAQRNVRPGDRIAIVRRPSAGFVAAVLGCVRVGAIAEVVEEVERGGAGSGAVRAVLDVGPTGETDDETIDIGGVLRDRGGPAALGAPVTHLADWAVDRFDLDRDDRFAVLSTEPGHLMSAVHSTLCAGATLVIPDPSVTGDTVALATWLRANAISVLYLRPALLRALAAPDPRPELPALKYVFVDNCGGFIPHDVEALRALSATCRCVGVYGVGPDGRPLAVYEVPDGWRRATAPLRMPLGAELPDNPAWLIGPSGRPAASGEIGEICFGSMRTGTIGRRWPDGALEFVRRVGASPIVDPLETMATLRDMPGVRDAVVTEHTGPDGRTTLLGCVAGPTPLDTVAVANFLRTELPGYLIPERIVVLDEIPRTAGGEYDLAAVPESGGGSAVAPEHVPPRTPVERELASIVAGLLDIDRIGVHDSFFELGGFSMLATRLTTRIRADFNVEVSLRDVFEAPTVDELAQLIVRAQGEQSGADELAALLDEIERSEPVGVDTAPDPDSGPDPDTDAAQNGNRPLYDQAVARLRASAVFGPDKPDETPDTSVQALWYAAAGTPRSIGGLSLPLPALSDEQERVLDHLVARRVAGEPLAYLTGLGNFMGLEFRTAPGALIPRRETELLGGATLALVREIAEARGTVRVLDLCTGSGNLAVSLAVLEPRARVWASDREADALTVAERNAALHRVIDRVTLVQSDLFEALDRLSPSPGPFDVVVCNPPYLPTQKAVSLPTGGFEPTAAFDGGDVGLSVLHRLIAEAPRHVVPDGWLCFELGAGMGRVVEKRLAGLGTYGETRTVVDRDGVTRAILVRTLP